MATSDSTTKVCTKCGQAKPATSQFFSVDKRRNNALTSQCRECRNAISAQSNRNRRKSLETRELEQQKIRDRMRSLRADPVKGKELADYYRLYSQTPEFKERRKQQRQTEQYKLKHRINENKRRTKKQSVGGNYTQDDIEIMYSQQEGMCAYCGIRIFFNIPHDVNIEHIVPIDKGGTNDISNLCLACDSCNSSKHNHMLNDWYKRRGW